MNAQPESKSSCLTSTAICSLKRTCITALAAASVFAFVIPARALSVNVVASSDTWVVFDVLWGEAPTGSTYLCCVNYRMGNRNIWIEDSGNHVAGATMDRETDLGITWNHSPFTILFPDAGPSGRAFENSVLTSDSLPTTRMFPLSETAYGARIVNGWNLPTSLSDNGSSALLCVGGLMGLLFAQRCLPRS